MFLKNKNIVFKIRRSKVTDYAALKENTSAAKCKHLFCLYTYPEPLGWDQSSKHFFSECCDVAYQINENGA